MPVKVSSDVQLVEAVITIGLVLAHWYVLP